MPKKPPAKPPSLRVSITEIMETLDLGRDAAYALLSSGLIKTRRLNPRGPYLLLRVDWEAFLAGRDARVDAA